MAEVYKITNKTNGKCYIGQAVKYLSQSKTKWGAIGRWKSHIREALSSQKDHCILLNNAIRKYGHNNFDLEVICDCDLDDIDNNEMLYIKQYNSLVPNGYNLKTGGAKGKDSEETRLKKKQMRIGKKHSDNVKANIGKGQLGNRRNKKPRKYPEDNDLPKYISIRRKNNKPFTYNIIGFPIGENEKKYISKSFSISKYGSKETTLQIAKEYLEQLKIKYAYIEKKRPIKNKTVCIETKVTYLINNEKQKLPEHIIPIYDGLKKIGYLVEEIIDNDGNKYPVKKFTTCTNRWNLDQAKKYLECVVNAKGCIDPDIELGRRRRDGTNSSLPKYINKYTKYNQILGYIVNGYPINGKKYSKCFSSKKLTMEDKFKLACDHLKELKEKYPIVRKDKNAKSTSKII